MPHAPHHTAPALCPNCGEVTQFSLHNAHVKQSKNISIQPILPTCLACGAEVRIHPAPAPGRDTRVIVLTGTCASGKSTTAEILVSRHGFSGIDGNGVMDVVKYKSGGARVEFNGPAVLREIGDQIDTLLALRQDIVLSHVIIPDDLPAYRELFRRRDLRYTIFVLQPEYAVAVSRSKARTSFSGITDEIWVKHFHDQLRGFAPQEDVVIVDNSACSAEESAERILRWKG